MYIKAHVRAGYRAAADYLNNQGENELTRLVSISDPDAKDLDQAFRNMWEVASTTKAQKPLLHFSINPFKDERLTDAQVQHIAKAYAAKCNMDIPHHQHVIVEHIKDGRQHFHIFLNRVSLETGKAVDPGLYKKKAKECAREMEIELGLKRLQPKSKGKAHILKTTLPYAGMLGEEDSPTPKRKSKTGKGEKGGDGAGGGANSSMSALKTTKKANNKKPAGKMNMAEPSRPGSGPERRQTKIWVPVERRQKL